MNGPGGRGILAVLAAGALLLGVVWSMSSDKDCEGSCLATDSAVLQDIAGWVERRVAEVNDLIIAEPAEPPQRAELGRGSLQGHHYLIEPTADRPYPGRWCPGTVGIHIDFAGARAAGMDVAREQRLWQQAADAWVTASAGAYSFDFRGEQAILADADGAGMALETIPTGTIGITYGGGPDGDPALRAAGDYLLADLQGDTAGHGGLATTVDGSPAESHSARSGYVIIDAEDTLRTLSPDDLRLALYIHELGHALGLAHAPGEDSIMSPEISAAHLVPETQDREAILDLAGLPCTSG